MAFMTMAMRDAVGGYAWSACAGASFRSYDYLADRPTTFAVGRITPVCLVRSGEIEFELGPSRHVFSAREGDAYVVLPGTPYSFRMKAGTRIEAVDLDDFQPGEAGIAILPARAVPTAVTEAFDRAATDRTPRRLLAAREAGVEMTRRLSQDGLARLEPSHNTARLLAVKRHLDEVFAEPVSLAAVAQRFGMDVSYLSREFHENFGVPPSRYLFLLRVEHFLARAMISRRPLARAAEESGVVDYPNFVRRFNRRFPAPPSRLMRSAA
jgi:AraC-like DNA-binding protein